MNTSEATKTFYGFIDQIGKDAIYTALAIGFAAMYFPLLGVAIVVCLVVASRHFATEDASRWPIQPGEHMEARSMNWRLLPLTCLSVLLGIGICSWLGIWPSLIIAVGCACLPNSTGSNFLKLGVCSGCGLVLLNSGMDHFFLRRFRGAIHEHFFGRHGVGSGAYNLLLGYLFVAGVEELIELIRQKWNPYDILVTPVRMVWDMLTVPKYFMGVIGRSPHLQAGNHAPIVCMFICYLNVCFVLALIVPAIPKSMQLSDRIARVVPHFVAIVICVFRSACTEESSPEMQNGWLRLDPDLKKQTSFRFYKEAAILFLLVVYLVLAK